MVSRFRSATLGLVGWVAVSLSCAETGTVVCSDTVRCPSGFYCAADQPVCIPESDGCGNGRLDPGEACDDGNLLPDDGCSADCSSTLECGNGIEDPGEECDCGADDVQSDLLVCGQRQNSDTSGFCSTSCRRHCGDGVVLADEELCDGVPSEGCVDLGYDSGHILCNFTCNGYVRSDCRHLGWNRTQALQPQQMNAVWVAGEGDVHIGGDIEITHFDGIDWRATYAVMGVGPERGIHSFWGFAADDIFAVGGGGLILRYDGAMWSPMFSGVSATLTGVWGSAPDNVYAVGAMGTLLHYDGGSWSRQTVPGAPDLQAIAGRSASDIHAVGLDGIWLHYDGMVWSEMVDVPTAQDLEAVWVSGPQDDRVLTVAVGENGIAVHRENGVFSVPISGLVGRLHGIWGLDSDHLIAVGVESTIVAYNGSEWLAQSVSEAAHLFAVHARSQDAVYAVGDYGTVLISEGEWRTVAVPADVQPRSIWANGDDVFLAGLESSLAWRVNGVWSQIPAVPDSKPYVGIGGVASDDVVVVGRNGTILHFDGATWDPGHSNPAYGQLFDVWGHAPSGQYYAVGREGVVLHYDGAAWSESRPRQPGTATLHAVFGCTPDDVYVAGERGLILHYDGAQWTLERQGMDLDLLEAIWGHCPGELFAVGRSGAILRKQGQAWIDDRALVTEVTLPGQPPPDLQSGFSMGPNDAYAVGDLGRILHWNGHSWAPVRALSTTDINAVAGNVDRGLVYFVAEARGLDVLRPPPYLQPMPPGMP